VPAVEARAAGEVQGEEQQGQDDEDDPERLHPARHPFVPSKVFVRLRHVKPPSMVLGKIDGADFIRQAARRLVKVVLIGLRPGD
jgi:hypothetical protein